MTRIGSYAFYGCSNLTSVTIPNSVTRIGSYAFYGCSNLTSIDSKVANVFNIADNTFEDETYNKAELHILGGLISKYQQATGWQRFKTIAEDKNIFACGDHLIGTYSDSDKKLTIQGDGAMWNYSYNSSVPWNLYQTNISTIVIEDGATTIGENAFNGCTDLYSVTFGKGVESVGTGAFKDCSNVRKVIATDLAAWCAINFADSYANPLYYTNKLYQDKTTVINELVIPDGVTHIGSYAFCNCFGLTSVTIPYSVTSISENAFSGCYGLHSIIFHCKEIETWFKNFTSIKEVMIGKEVTSISQQAFAGCTGLQSVYSKVEDVFSINKNTFDDNTYTTAKLYVPGGMKAVYEDTPWWLNFTNIEEFDYPAGIAAPQLGKDVKVVDAYQLNGLKRNDVQRGLYIVRMSDGTTKKVVVK